MKKLSLSLFLVFFSLLIQPTYAKISNEALEWPDLEMNHEYELNQMISFPDLIDFKSGEKFEMVDIIAGDIPAVYFQFQQVDCKKPELQAEMIIINPNPEDHSTDRSIAVELEKNCLVGIWVELKDLYSPSVFSSMAN